MSDAISNLLGIVVLLGGPLMTGFFLYEAFKSLRLVMRGRVATGKITSIRWGQNRSGKRIAYPTVEFVTANGQRLSFDSPSSVSPPTHKIGAVVPIRYMPDRPTTCSIDSFGHLWLGPIILGVIGIPWLLYGLSTLSSCNGQSLLACLGQ